MVIDLEIEKIILFILKNKFISNNKWYDKSLILRLKVQLHKVREMTRLTLLAEDVAEKLFIGNIKDAGHADIPKLK